MENTNPDIIRFLTEAMPPAEETDFRRRLAAEPELQKEFEDYVLLSKSRELIIQQNIAAEVGPGIAAAHQRALQASRRRRWVLGLGAMLLLLLLVFGGIQFSSLQQQYHKDKVVQEAMILPLDPRNAGNGDYATGITAFFDAQDYARAATTLEPLWASAAGQLDSLSAEAATQARTAYLLLPHCYFKLADYGQAETGFSGILTDPADYYDSNTLAKVRWNHWLSRYAQGKSPLTEAPELGFEQEEISRFRHKSSSRWYRLFN